MGTQKKGILTPGIGKCIVKDESVRQLPNLEKNVQKTADGGLLVTALSLYDLSITYTTTTTL